jgi:ribosomal protein S18 acetylase RimI-like enzyme
MGACDGMIHIRRARETDARGLAEVHVRTWQEAYRDNLPGSYLKALSIDAREGHWRKELHAISAERRPWVAEATGQIVGFVAAGTARDEAADPHTGEVYAVYVLPDCWDRGVGRTLLAHAEHDLLEHGYEDAVLWVLADNERARAFYEMAGWQADGGTKHDIIGGREVEEVRYRLTLERSRVAELI